MVALVLFCPWTEHHEARHDATVCPSCGAEEPWIPDEPSINARVIRLAMWGRKYGALRTAPLRACDEGRAQSAGDGVKHFRHATTPLRYLGWSIP